MSHIGQHVIETEELSGDFEEYLAPESQLPPDYQKSIDRDYADKQWWKSLDKDMESDSPPF